MTNKTIDAWLTIHNGLKHYHDNYHLKYFKEGHDVSFDTYNLTLLKYEDLKEIVEAIEDPDSDRNKWIKIPKLASPSFINLCTKCGERVYFETNGKDVRATSRCKFYNGHPPYEFELEIPSGKMVVANDLRRLFDEDETIRNSVDWNSEVGMNEYVKLWAKNKLAHAFVGNTCPRLIKLNDDAYTIGNVPIDFTEDEVIGDTVANITTDLWWYSICDYDEFTKRSAGKSRKYYESVVDVKPGTYKFYHQYHLVNNVNVDSFVNYTWIKRAK